MEAFWSSTNDLIIMKRSFHSELDTKSELYFSGWPRPASRPEHGLTFYRLGGRYDEYQTIPSLRGTKQSDCYRKFYDCRAPLAMTKNRTTCEKSHHSTLDTKSELYFPGYRLGGQYDEHYKRINISLSLGWVGTT